MEVITNFSISKRDHGKNGAMSGLNIETSMAVNVLSVVSAGEPSLRITSPLYSAKFSRY